MPRFYDSHNEGPLGRYVVPFSSHEILKIFCLTFSHDPEDSKRIMLLSVRPDPINRLALQASPPQLVRQETSSCFIVHNNGAAFLYSKYATTRETILGLRSFLTTLLWMKGLDRSKSF
ncbi:UNVERIFIED_CONTAM: hypothetical protein Slati_1334600 [Sesamum latifolium]|uniref:Uncharacterized protein n=1 Tax=Sesamum latifolium TaxID=2727402 RepID=A0AAW2XHC3_9LAMI